MNLCGNKINIIFTLLTMVAVCSAGCAAPKNKGYALAKATTPLSYLQIITGNENAENLYIGTCGGYHYFRYSKRFGSAKYRISETLLTLETTFPTGTGESYTITPEMLKKGSVLIPER